uniref:Uncharacterized protein n=1 Tax=Tanacetum cinerariifolium TaxID=118510 RepID=A0A699GFD0_TANCI|nr:hypothetical protein [Tanacetum cinerariifolium]
MMHARLAKIVYGAPDPKTGACGSVVNLFGQAQLNHHAVVTGGVLADACADLLKRFFAARRAAAAAARRAAPDQQGQQGQQHRPPGTARLCDPQLLRPRRAPPALRRHRCGAPGAAACGGGRPRGPGRDGAARVVRHEPAAGGHRLCRHGRQRQAVRGLQRLHGVSDGADGADGPRQLCRPHVCQRLRPAAARCVHGRPVPRLPARPATPRRGHGGAGPGGQPAGGRDRPPVGRQFGDDGQPARHAVFFHARQRHRLPRRRGRAPVPGGAHAAATAVRGRVRGPACAGAGRVYRLQAGRVRQRLRLRDHAGVPPRPAAAAGADRPAVRPHRAPGHAAVRRHGAPDVVRARYRADHFRLPHAIQPDHDAAAGVRGVEQAGRTVRKRCVVGLAVGRRGQAQVAAFGKDFQVLVDAVGNLGVHVARGVLEVGRARVVRQHGRAAAGRIRIVVDGGAAAPGDAGEFRAHRLQRHARRQRAVVVPQPGVIRVFRFAHRRQFLARQQVHDALRRVGRLELGVVEIDPEEAQLPRQESQRRFAAELGPGARDVGTIFVRAVVEVDIAHRLPRLRIGHAGAVEDAQVGAAHDHVGANDAHLAEAGHRERRIVVRIPFQRQILVLVGLRAQRGVADGGVAAVLARQFLAAGADPALVVRAFAGRHQGGNGRPRDLLGAVVPQHQLVRDHPQRHVQDRHVVGGVGRKRGGAAHGGAGGAARGVGQVRVVAGRLADRRERHGAAGFHLGAHDAVAEVTVELHIERQARVGERDLVEAEVGHEVAGGDALLVLVDGLAVHLAVGGHALLDAVEIGVGRAHQRKHFFHVDLVPPVDQLGRPVGRAVEEGRIGTLHGLGDDIQKLLLGHVGRARQCGGQVGVGHETGRAQLAAGAQRSRRVLASLEEAAHIGGGHHHRRHVTRCAELADRGDHRAAAGAPFAAGIVAQVEAGLDTLEEWNVVAERVAEIALGRDFLGLGHLRRVRQLRRLRHRRLLGDGVGGNIRVVDRRLDLGGRDGRPHQVGIQRRVGLVEGAAGRELIRPQSVWQDLHGGRPVVGAPVGALVGPLPVRAGVAHEKFRRKAAVAVRAAGLGVPGGGVHGVEDLVGVDVAVRDRHFRHVVVGVHLDRARIDIGHGTLRREQAGAEAHIAVQVVAGTGHGAAHPGGGIGKRGPRVGGAVGTGRIDGQAAHAVGHEGIVHRALGVIDLAVHAERVADLEVEPQVDVLALVFLAFLDVAHQRRRVIVPLVQARHQLVATGIDRRVLGGIAVDAGLLRGRQVGKRGVTVGLGLGGGRLGQDFQRRGGVEEAAGRQRRLQGGRGVGGIAGRHGAWQIGERLVRRIVEVERARIALQPRRGVLRRVRLVDHARRRRIDHQAQPVVEKFPGGDQVGVGRPFLVQRTLRAGHAQRDERFLEVQAGTGLDDHAAAERAFGHVGRGAFDHVHALDQVGRQRAEFHAAAAAAIHVGAAGRLHALAVDLHARQVGRVAADGDAHALAEIAAVERHAGNARDRFADIAVGEGPHVFGHDGIHRGGSVLLALDAGLLRGARALHDDFLDLGVAAGGGGSKDENREWIVEMKRITELSGIVALPQKRDLAQCLARWLAQWLGIAAGGAAPATRAPPGRTRRAGGAAVLRPPRQAGPAERLSP